MRICFALGRVRAEKLAQRTLVLTIYSRKTATEQWRRFPACPQSGALHDCTS